MHMIGKEEGKLEVNYYLMTCNASLYSGAFNHFDDLFNPFGARIKCQCGVQQTRI